MRALKFRCWDIDNKEFVYVSETTDGEIWINNGISTVAMPEHKTPYEQYTGLKDKNGKEIYEGDIIQCHLSPISSTIFTGVVEFRPGCIMFKNFADGGAYAFNFLGAIEAVIGNIHENPELLGGEK